MAYYPNHDELNALGNTVAEEFSITRSSEYQNCSPRVICSVSPNDQISSSETIDASNQSLSSDDSIDPTGSGFP